MSLIKRALINGFIFSASVLLALIAFETFLVLHNRSEAVDLISVDIKGYRYEFIREAHTPSPLTFDNQKKELLLLGDSFVAGVSCAGIGKNLSGHLNQLPESEYRAVNLGVGGINPADYIDILDEIPIGKEDSVLVVLYDNDIHLSARNCQQIKRQSVDYSSYVPPVCNSKESFVDKSNQTIGSNANNLLKRFKVTQLVKESLAQIPYLTPFFYRTNYQRRWSDFESEENTWIRSSLLTMSDIVHQKGAQLRFSYYPNTNRISKDDVRHANWLKFLAYMAEHEGVTVSDPYPFFIDQADGQSMVWSLTDKHPSCDAHYLMAEFTAQDLKRSGMTRTGG